MKKTLSILTLLLALTLTAGAQSLSSKLVGTWTASVPDDNEMTNCTFELTLNRNGSSIFRMDAIAIEEEGGSSSKMKFYFTLNGKWSLENETLKLENDINSLNAKVVEMFLDGESMEGLLGIASEAMTNSLKEAEGTYQSIRFENFKFADQNTIAVKFDDTSVYFHRKTAK